MQTPDLPADERTRLETLLSLNLLDTAPEERFDRLTRLAKRLFDVPISLVSIVDSDRQWFKSSQGLDAKQTPRDISFCGHSILGNDIFIIPNALQDERFADNPLVTDEPNIRFYAGCPLTVKNGSKLGTLCVIDNKPREFSEEDRSLLKDLAVMVEQEIEAIQLSTLDELTLISNRRGFIALSEHALKLCKRHNTCVSLLMFDLDSFKEINDDYGHAEGDYALKVFAGMMQKIFRESDVFARLGGDEFVALLCGVDQDRLTEVLARFQSLLKQYNDETHRGYELAYSVGHISCSAEQISSIDILLDEADKAMYLNKNARKSKPSGL